MNAAGFEGTPWEAGVSLLAQHRHKQAWTQFHLSSTCGLSIPGDALPLVVFVALHWLCSMWLNLSTISSAQVWSHLLGAWYQGERKRDRFPNPPHQRFQDPTDTVALRAPRYTEALKILYSL